MTDKKRIENTSNPLQLNDDDLTPLSGMVESLLLGGWVNPTDYKRHYALPTPPKVMKRIKNTINKRIFINESVLRSLKTQSMKKTYKKICFLMEHNSIIRDPRVEKRISKLLNILYYNFIDATQLSIINKISSIKDRLSDGTHKDSNTLPTKGCRIFNSNHTEFIGELLKEINDVESIKVHNEIISIRNKLKRHFWLC